MSNTTPREDTSGVKKKEEHMFTYPFKTSDNSLHSSCSGLHEFSHHSKEGDLNDSMYGRQGMTSPIVIDETSLSSVTPGHDMDNDMINFSFSW